MIVYRAINENDEFNLKVFGNDMNCSLLNSCIRYLKTGAGDLEVLRDYYTLCIKGKRKYALDTIIGHINGEKTGVELSPWISVSPDFEFVASEYSIPQAGKYNSTNRRKPIVIVDIEDREIKRTVKDIKSLRENDTKRSFTIDLRNGNLNNLYINGAISAEKYNEDMPGYDEKQAALKEVNAENGYINSVGGFSNFSKSTDELLVFKAIEKSSVMAILSPALVDIIYACNIDVDRNIGFILKNYNSLNKFLANYNSKLIGTNLIKVLENKNVFIAGGNIEIKYKNIKKMKLTEIKRIVEYINKKYKTNFEATRVIDDKVYVKYYNNLPNLSKKGRNDLLLIEKDNHLYGYDYEKKGYYNKELEEVIPVKEINKLINKQISLSDVKLKKKTLSSQ